ncbi:MAG: glycogen debranching enzyme, partial [Desulfobulbaceae bacterium]|nr:glycogen debranching enzyme [Desulfobulbaceae bacterium]
LKNGENNRDGCNHEISWNSGKEGETSNHKIIRLRNRRQRTMAVILLLSQGVPMLTAGDEFNRSQGGNNNAYCQDNAISWLDWQLAEKNKDLQRFFQLLIAMRKAHPVFRRANFFPTINSNNQPTIHWQSTKPGIEDWSPEAKTLAFFLDGGSANNKERDDDFFLMLNGHNRPRTFTAPPPPEGRHWLKIIDTGADSPDDIMTAAEASPLHNHKITVAGMAAVALISTPNP